VARRKLWTAVELKWVAIPSAFISLVKQDQKEKTLNWKTIRAVAATVTTLCRAAPMRASLVMSAVAAIVTLPFLAVLVAMVIMFNQVNGRLDAIQADNQRQHDATRTEMNQMRAEVNRRFDLMQADNQRQHDAIEEVLRLFEGRITRLEERSGIDGDGAE